MGEHGGTHMDAPHHMYKEGLTLGKIPLSKLLNLPLVVVDLTEKVKQDNDTLVGCYRTVLPDLQIGPRMWLYHVSSKYITNN